MCSAPTASLGRIPPPAVPPTAASAGGGCLLWEGGLAPLGVSASWGRVCGAAALVGEPPLPPAPVSHTLGPLQPGPTGPPLPRSRRRASPPTEADPPVCRLPSKAAHLFSLKRLAGNRCLMFVEWTNGMFISISTHLRVVPNPEVTSPPPHIPPRTRVWHLLPGPAQTPLFNSASVHERILTLRGPGPGRKWRRPPRASPPPGARGARRGSVPGRGITQLRGGRACGLRV